MRLGLLSLARPFLTSPITTRPLFVGSSSYPQTPTLTRTVKQVRGQKHDPMSGPNPALTPNLQKDPVTGEMVSKTSVNPLGMDFCKQWLVRNRQRRVNGMNVPFALLPAAS